VRRSPRDLSGPQVDPGARIHGDFLRAVYSKGPNFYAPFPREAINSFHGASAKPMRDTWKEMKMSMQSAAPREGARGSVRPVTYRICRSRELDGSLSVTVETSQLLRVRQAIVQSGCKPVGIVKAAPIAGGTRVRLLIALRPEFVQAVMDAIMRCVGAGEFGPASPRVEA
jgi:hypothetical protein